MSWRKQPRRVSVLAEMALRREKIAQRLGELREANTLTQEQAAAKVGVTLRQWQRWEAGESVPYPRNMDGIASHFGLSVSEFFDENPLSDGRTTILEAKVEELEGVLAQMLARLDALDADAIERDEETAAARAVQPGAKTAGSARGRKRSGS